MRLTVQPFSLWVAYAITAPRAVQRLLPDHLRLSPTKLLSTDRTSSCKLLFNSYDVTSSPWMKGHRVEVLTMAFDPSEKTHHLVILDCLSNVASWDPVNGVQPANAQVKRRRMRSDATDFGRLEIVKDGVTQLEVAGKTVPPYVVPDRRFVVDANRKCYFKNFPMGIDMTFQDESVMTPVLRLPRSSVRRNALWQAVRSPRPSHTFVHTREMGFDVKVPDLWYT